MHMDTADKQGHEHVGPSSHASSRHAQRLDSAGGAAEWCACRCAEQFTDPMGMQRAFAQLSGSDRMNFIRVVTLATHAGREEGTDSISECATALPCTLGGSDSEPTVRGTLTGQATPPPKSPVAPPMQLVVRGFRVCCDFAQNLVGLSRDDILAQLRHSSGLTHTKSLFEWQNEQSKREQEESQHCAKLSASTESLLVFLDRLYNLYGSVEFNADAHPLSIHGTLPMAQTKAQVLAQFTQHLAKFTEEARQANVKLPSLKLFTKVWHEHRPHYHVCSRLPCRVCTTLQAQTAQSEFLSSKRPKHIDQTDCVSHQVKKLRETIAALQSQHNTDVDERIAQLKRDLLQVASPTPTTATSGHAVQSTSPQQLPVQAPTTAMSAASFSTTTGGRSAIHLPQHGAQSDLYILKEPSVTQVPLSYLGQDKLIQRHGIKLTTLCVSVAHERPAPLHCMFPLQEGHYPQSLGVVNHVLSVLFYTVLHKRASSTAIVYCPSALKVPSVALFIQRLVDARIYAAVELRFLPHGHDVSIACDVQTLISTALQQVERCESPDEFRALLALLPNSLVVNPCKDKLAWLNWTAPMVLDHYLLPTQRLLHHATWLKCSSHSSMLLGHGCCREHARESAMRSFTMHTGDGQHTASFAHVLEQCRVSQWEHLCDVPCPMAPNQLSYLVDVLSPSLDQSLPEFMSCGDATCPFSFEAQIRAFAQKQPPRAQTSDRSKEATAQPPNATVAQVSGTGIPVAIQARRTTKRRCGICHTPGHTRKTCAQAPQSASSQAIMLMQAALNPMEARPQHSASPVTSDSPAVQLTPDGPINMAQYMEVPQVPSNIKLVRQSEHGEQMPLTRAQLVAWTQQLPNPV
eukprot:m.245781 g.245781  ORF g.245781 m.245781 type:complete len:858 (-) comp15368_c0_seq2:2082-4655(-)